MRPRSFRARLRRPPTEVGGLPKPNSSFPKSDNPAFEMPSLSFEEELYAGNKEIVSSKEVVGEKVQQGSQQDGGQRDAAQEARDAEVRPGRQGRNGEEPQAGNRDRAIGGAQERREGPEKESGLRNLTLGLSFLPSRMDPCLF